jgi:DNA repair exonuclease SbcCD ATPase subunit
MIPKRVELENFLSFAGLVEFCFDDGEPLWVLSGPNGVGKSAVFDVITYCLYGKHRGGTLKAEQLIHHGANGFRVVFEFEFAGRDYRITKTCALGKKKNTTQKLEQRSGPTAGDWESVPGMNRAADIEGWVKKTLGLEYEAFTTSVLLRQGEADKLFSSSREDRLSLLKGIIGFDQFKQLSERVHAQSSRVKVEVETLLKQKEGVEEVTEEEQREAEETLNTAVLDWETAQARLSAAVRCVERAKQWERLESQRVHLARQIDEADSRARDAESIRSDKARLDDLAGTVPLLVAAVRLRTQITGLEREALLARSTEEQRSAERDERGKAAEMARQKAAAHKQAMEAKEREAQALQEAIDRGNKFLALARDVERLVAEVACYPADLPAQVATAIQAEEEADQARRIATGEHSRSEALLTLARTQQRQFADVEVGVTCSLCGQVVNEAHAARERNRLADEVRRWEGEVSRLKAAALGTERRFAAVKKQRAALEKQQKDHDNLRTERTSKEHSLRQLGVNADAGELERTIAEQAARKETTQREGESERTHYLEASAETTRLERERASLDTVIKAARTESQRCASSLAARRGQEQAAVARLSAGWQARLSSLDSQAVDALAEERDRLEQAGVAARFAQWQQDAALRGMWEQQREQVDLEIAAIPCNARLAAHEATRVQQQATIAAAQADRARGEAQRRVDTLRHRAKQYDELTTRVRIAQRQHELHRTLDTLLGQNGLQRELARAAEEDIVALANDTLQNLTEGELSLEQDEEATGRDDKAFALRVRKAGDPSPIGVMFLSGSQ